jgi:hypothetical protein
MRFQNKKPIAWQPSPACGSNPPSSPSDITFGFQWLDGKEPVVAKVSEGRCELFQELIFMRHSVQTWQTLDFFLF